jgi:hypothetical protein
VSANSNLVGTVGVADFRLGAGVVGGPADVFPQPTNAR